MMAADTSRSAKGQHRKWSDAVRFAGWYATIVGILMFAMWIVFFTVLGVPELETEPIRVAFHFVAEFVTATALLASGYGLLTNKPWGASAYLLAMGMLIYIAINGPGYFAQQGDWAFVGMFAVLLILACVTVVRLFRAQALRSP